MGKKKNPVEKQKTNNEIDALESQEITNLESLIAKIESTGTPHQKKWLPNLKVNLENLKRLK